MLVEKEIIGVNLKRSKSSKLGYFYTQQNNENYLDKYNECHILCIDDNVCN